jgi:RNA polymerase sigma factor (sigma-70 family)
MAKKPKSDTSWSDSAIVLHDRYLVAGSDEERRSIEADVVQVYMPAIVSMAKREARIHHVDPLDLTQEGRIGVLEAFRDWGMPRRTPEFDRWGLTYARNRMRHYYRDHGFTVRMPQTCFRNGEPFAGYDVLRDIHLAVPDADDERPAPMWGDGDSRRPAAECVRDAMGVLTPRQWLAVRLRWGLDTGDGCPVGPHAVREAAEAMGISESAVDGHLAEAYWKMKNQITGVRNEPPPRVAAKRSRVRSYGKRRTADPNRSWAKALHGKQS